MLVATNLMFQCMESCTSPSQCLHLLFTDQSPSIFPSQRSLWLHINQRGTTTKFYSNIYDF